MKTNAIVRIVLFSIAILILLAILTSALLANSLMINFSDSGFMEVVGEVLSVDDSGDITLDGTGQSGEYDAAQIRDLEIEWVAGTIVIRPGDTDSIRFEESAVSDTKYQLVTKRSGDKLTLKFSEDNAAKWNFGININTNISKDLVITVPKDWSCDTLEIDTASARVEISDLQINEVDFDGASGLCVFDNCVIGQLDIDTASGDVEFTGTLRTLDFDAASACFRGTFRNTPESLNLDSMSGDLDIALPENCGFTASLDTMSGDFTSDFQTTISNGRYNYGDGSCRINVTAMSGDVVVRKAQ